MMTMAAVKALVALSVGTVVLQMMTMVVIVLAVGGMVAVILCLRRR